MLQKIEFNLGRSFTYDVPSAMPKDWVNSRYIVMKNENQ